MAYVSRLEGGYGTGVSVIQNDSTHNAILVPDAGLLLSGVYHRSGPDLVLTGQDGRHHIIPGYFSSEHPPALVAPNGMSLSGATVEIMAGSPTPGHYAQAQPAAPADGGIGKVEKSVGDVTAVRNGVSVTLNVGDAVYKSDMIQTGTASSVGISFPDGTALNLVANTRMALNDYSYTPTSNSNDALFTLVEGTFAFVAGKVAHTGDMKINTPVATMGIRGTTGMVQQEASHPVPSPDGSQPLGTFSANVYGVTYNFLLAADFGTGLAGLYDLTAVDANGNPILDANGNPAVHLAVSLTGYVTSLTAQGQGLPPLVSVEPITNSQYAAEQTMLADLFATLNPLNQQNNNSNGSSSPPPAPTQSPIENFVVPPPPPPPPNNGPDGPTFTFTQSPSANGQSGPTAVVFFTNPNGGIWEYAGNWSDGFIPTSFSLVEILIPVTVTVNAPETSNGLVLFSGATLEIESGASLEVNDTVTGAGTVELNASGSDPKLIINGLVTLTGETDVQQDGTTILHPGGEILLTGSPSSDDLIVGVHSTQNPAELDNVNFTITGAGQIGQGDGNLTFINTGTVDATGLLVIDTGNQVANNAGGMFEATAGGTLQLDDSVSNGGTIEANGGTVNINLGLDNSGTVEALANGTVNFAAGSTDHNHSSSTIESTGTDALIDFSGGKLTNDGTVEADNGGAITFTGNLQFVNNGLIEVNGGSMTVGSNVTFSGAGSLEIAGGGKADFLGAFSENTAFTGNGTLELNQAYGGTVSGFASGDVIDLHNIAFSTGEYDLWTQGTGTLAIYSATGTLEETLHLTGTYSPGTFVLASDGDSLPGTQVQFGVLAAGTVTAAGGVEDVTATTLSATFTDANAGATTSDFSGTIAWGDGVTTSFTSSAVTEHNGVFTVAGSHIYAEEGSYGPVVTINDDGGSTVTESGSTTVADAPLTAGTVTAAGGVEDVTATTLSATFTDANAGATTADFSGTIAWGDGVTTSFTSGAVTEHNGVFTVAGSHIYAEEGTYGPVVTINDDGGSTTTETGSTTVADAPLTAGTVTAAGGVEDVTATTLSATFTDANAGATTADFSGTIAWGDGQTTSFTSGAVSEHNGVFTVAGSHIYAEEGSYGPVVTINDDGGSTTTESGSTTVADAPLTAGTVTAAGGVEDFTAATLSATFTDANAGATTADFSGTIAWGDGQTTSFTSGAVSEHNGVFTVAGSHIYAEEGSYGPVVTINDDGGSTTTESGSTTVADAPLTAGTVTAAGGVEDFTAATLSATFTDANAGATTADFSGTIAWGDGQTTSFTSGAVTEHNGVFTVAGSHIYAEEGSYGPVVTINDDGGSTTTESGSTTVADAPLTAGTVTAAGGVEDFTAATLSATFTDANAGATTADFSGTIAWGDGQTTSFTSGAVSEHNGVFTVAGSHIYAEEGSYGPVVTINDDGGSTVTESGSTTVADAPLTAGTVTAAGGVEDVTAATLSATFTDANAGATTADFSGTIAWGDGQTTSFTSGAVTEHNGVFTVAGSHIYAEEGSYGPVVTINDDGGSTTTESGSTTVADAPLTAGTVTAAGGVEDVTATTLSATFTDANAGATTSDFSGTIAWGDGQTTSFTSGAVSEHNGVFTVAGSHIYAEEGTYGPVVTINDDGGSTTTESGSTTVADAPLTAGMVTAAGGVEDVTAATLSATFTDANAGATTSDFSGTIAWGDGQTTSFTSGAVSEHNGVFTVAGSHIYAEEGSYGPVVTINDDGGSTTTESGSTTVADAPLTAGTVTAVGGVEDVTATTLSATFTDANAGATTSDFSGTIAWGDGQTTSFTSGAVSEHNGVFTVAGSHIYAEEGTYGPVVTINDDGGSTVTESGSTTVADSNLVVNGGFENGLSGWTTNGIQPQYDFVDTQHAHSGGHDFALGAINAEYQISQNIATTVGQTYEIQFWLENPAGGTPSNFTASFGGDTLLSLTNTSRQGYTEYTYDVTATSALTKLLFTAEQNPAYWYLDDVSVEPVVAAMIAAGSLLEITSANAQTVVFAGSTGTLELAQPATFTGQIGGIAGNGDVLDLIGLSASDTATTGAGSYHSSTGTTTLTVKDSGGHTVDTLTLVGDYSASNWTVASDHHGGIDVVDPPGTPATSADDAASVPTDGTLKIGAEPLSVSGATGTIVPDQSSTFTESPAALAAASGTGDAPIMIAGATATISGASSQTVGFAAGSLGTLVLDNPESFTGHIENFTGTAPDAAHSDVIDLVGINYDSGHFSESYNASTGVLTLSDGTDTANLTFDNFKATFEFASDGKGGTDIFDPPAPGSNGGSQTGPSQVGQSPVGHGMDFGHDQISLASGGIAPGISGGNGHGPMNSQSSGNAPSGSVSVGGNDHFTFQSANWTPANHDAPASQPPSGQGEVHTPAGNEQLTALLTHEAVFDPVADATHNDSAAIAQFHQIVASAGHLH